ncbi:MAG: tetratricopeptide repeat protein, partial [Candidatus Methanofastidiosia archaeon]
MSDEIQKAVRELIDQADEIFRNDARRNESRLLYEEALSRARAAGMYAMEEYVRGKIELLNERWKEAAEHFQKVLELERDFPKAWQYKGLAMDEMGKYQEALECYSRALEINPEDEDAWFNKGLCLDEMERYEEALECYSRAL